MSGRPVRSALFAVILIATALGVSFFVPAEYVKSFSGAPDEKAITVEVVDRNGEFGVVTLPRRTFEGSNAVRVPARALRFA